MRRSTLKRDLTITKEMERYLPGMTSAEKRRIALGHKVSEDGFVCPSGSKPGVHYCVSVKKTERHVKVRDTKDPTKTTLIFNKEEWRIFVDGVKNGEFDV